MHGVNVFISDILANVSAGNACVLYFLNILIDTTLGESPCFGGWNLLTEGILGVAIIYLFLHLLTYFFTEKCHFQGFKSGQYGTPPSLAFWGRQAAVYVFSLTSMKLLVVVLFALWPGVFTLGEWMLSFLGTSDTAQIILCVPPPVVLFAALTYRALFSVMGLFPIIMNIVQFWLIDSIVKSNAESDSDVHPSSATSRHSYDREPLFNHNSDDDDDDDDDRPHDIENPPTYSPASSSGHDHISSSTPAESKLSVPSSMTATGSGGSSPKAVDLARGQAIAMHSYPPVGSTSTSPVSSGSLHSRASSISPSSSKRRRRSPPPPLTLSPRAGFPKVVVTPQTQIQKPVAQKSVVDTLVQDEKADWAAWGEDATDDWADKVGEEEWTGRRIEAQTATLQDVWAQHEEFRPTAIRAG